MKIATRLVFLLFSTVSLSQLDYPKASPKSTVKQEIGFTTITIDYSRPAAKGRKIFGDLVPYDRIWRVGANESTKFSTDTQITILGNQLAAGTYALYAFPEKDAWEIVIHKNTSHWGDGRTNYDSEEDVFRVSVNPENTQAYQENFLIMFDSISHNKANLVWHWANTKVSIPITVNTHEIMESQIAKELVNKPTAQTYYEVARYYVEQDIKYETALAYLNKALEIGGERYYFHRVKSLAEAALGNYTSAIVSAEKSWKLAQQEGKDEFVRMNQKNIDFWKKKQKQ